MSCSEAVPQACTGLLQLSVHDVLRQQYYHNSKPKLLPMQSWGLYSMIGQIAFLKCVYDNSDRVKSSCLWLLRFSTTLNPKP